jgi:hypothetical protein
MEVRTMPTLAEALGVETPRPPEDGPTLADVLTPRRGGFAEVQMLPMGQTRRTDGYGTEAEYLASQRWASPLRPRGNERNSHRRWQPYVGEVGAILETKDRRWGNGIARRMRARAIAAATWYGCPNIILGQ